MNAEADLGGTLISNGVTFLIYHNKNSKVIMKTISKIKLFKVEEMKNGTIRLQSQLMLGRDSVDFIIKDGILKHHGWKPKKGWDFHECNEPYEIVENRKDMLTQQL
jgi:hypothetical protein